MNSLKAYLIFFVTGEEDQSFSFHEENSAAGNLGSKNMRIVFTILLKSSQIALYFNQFFEKIVKSEFPPDP